MSFKYFDHLKEEQLHSISFFVFLKKIVFYIFRKIDAILSILNYFQIFKLDAKEFEARH